MYSPCVHLLGVNIVRFCHTLQEPRMGSKCLKRKQEIQAREGKSALLFRFKSTQSAGKTLFTAVDVSDGY